MSELPIGDYRVTYELSGFQRHVRDEVHLTAGFTAEINVALKVGAVAETVTVSGQTPVVDTTGAAPSVNLSNQFLTEVLPVTRRIQDILATTPGMSTRFAADLGGGTSGGGGLHQLRHHRTVNDDDRRRQPRDEPRSQRAGQYGAKNAFHGAFCP